VNTNLLLYCNLHLVTKMLKHKPNCRHIEICNLFFFMFFWKIDLILTHFHKHYLMFSIKFSNYKRLQFFILLFKSEWQSLNIFNKMQAQ